MPSNWTKQPQYTTAKFLNLNNSTGDATQGGALTTTPSGVGSQGIQDIPGDRIILGSADALVMSDNSVGNLYGGLYQYVNTRNNSSSAPTRAHGCFWDLVGMNNVDSLARVTSDEPANNGYAFFAGVFINSPTKGNFWWIQAMGKVFAQFRTTVTAAGAIGAGVYLTAGGNNNNAVDVGSFDTLAAATNLTDPQLQKYIGVQEVAASNNNISLIDMPMGRMFRW